MKLKQIELAFAGLLGLAVIYKLLNPIVYAVIIACLMSPFFNKLVDILKNRAISAFLIVLLTVGIIVAPALRLIQFVFTNADKISLLLTRAVSEGSKLLASMGIDYAPPALSGEFVLSATSWFIQVPILIIHLFITLTLVFIFLKDGPKLKSYLMNIADNTQKKILSEVEKLLHAIVFGYIASAIIIGIVAFFGFTLLGINYAVFLALSVGILALIPIIGSWAIYIPLIIYYIVYQNLFLASGLIGLTFITVLLEVFLRPALTSKISKFHVALMFVGFIGGLIFFGFKGILIGPMALGTIKIILDHYNDR